MSIENLNFFSAVELSEFDQNFFPYPWSLDQWDHIFLNQKDYYFKGIRKNEELLGFILILKNEMNNYWHLLKIAVRLDARRQGLAKSY